MPRKKSTAPKKPRKTAGVVAAKNDLTIDKVLASLSDEEQFVLAHDWRLWARPEQLLPMGHWDIWMVLSGRGYGKTRLGAEAVREWVNKDGVKRIHLVARTAADARDTMIEGSSGLISVCQGDVGNIPVYNPSKRKISWPNGAVALIFSAEEPDALRGPQCLVAGTLVTMADLSEEPIEDIVVGDQVLTSKGPRYVTDSWLSRKDAELYEIILSGGERIIGTPEHPVWVNGAFKPLSEIKRGDVACRLYYRMTSLIRQMFNGAQDTPVYCADASVISASPLDRREDVYNITVADQHEFFANGVLVKNCERWWADELASWKYLQDTWDMLQMGARLGDHVQGIITTTPRPLPLLKKLIARSQNGDGSVLVTRGRTLDNRDNLSPNFIKAMVDQYGGTRLGRQELDGEILDDNPNALWSRQMIEVARMTKAPTLHKVVIGVDPNVSHGDGADECGIVAVAKDKARPAHYYVLEDASIPHPRPQEWAEQAVACYHRNQACAMVVETNQGGDMVEHTIHTIDPRVNVVAVKAKQGKMLRAESVSALYEQGRVHHVGLFPNLEDEMAEFDGTSNQESPDRLDALVHGVRYLNEIYKTAGGPQSWVSRRTIGV